MKRTTFSSGLDKTVSGSIINACDFGKNSDPFLFLSRFCSKSVSAYSKHFCPCPIPYNLLLMTWLLYTHDPLFKNLHTKRTFRKIIVRIRTLVHKSSTNYGSMGI